MVDGMHGNLAVLQAVPGAAGHAVRVATDGQRALQRAAPAAPDNVLLDAVMPGIDGFEAARRLKSGRPRRRTSPSP